MNLYTCILTSLTAGAVMLATTQASADSAPMTHDGFYMHISAGLGYQSATYKSPQPNLVPDLKVSGLAFDTALLLGGTVGPVVIGGGFIYDTIPSPSAKQGNQSQDLQDVSQYMIGIGPFVDVYPDPAGGLHFLGFFGWGGLETSYQGDAGGSDPTGLVVVLGAGYDFWIADEWSVGPLARFTYAPLSYQDIDVPVTAFGVVADFKYH